MTPTSSPPGPKSPAPAGSPMPFGRPRPPLTASALLAHNPLRPVPRSVLAPRLEELDQRRHQISSLVHLLTNLRRPRAIAHPVEREPHDVQILNVAVAHQI